MLEMAGTYLFLIFFFSIFFTEGIGLVGQLPTYYILLITPLFFFFPFMFRRNRLHVPRLLSGVGIIFFLLSLISLIFSIHIQNSFERVLLDVALFLVFLFFYTLKKHISKHTLVAFAAVVLVLSLYSVFLNYFLPPNLKYLLPTQDTQYVYALLGTQLPLATLLSPFIIILFAHYFSTRLKKYLILGFVFSIFLFSTLSRAAMTMFGVGAVLLVFLTRFGKRVNIHLKEGLLVFFTITTILIFIVGTIYFKEITKAISFLTPFSFSHTKIENKTALGSRDKYFGVAIWEVSDKPLFGVGPGNYYTASLSHYTHENLATTSHNMFLDVFAERGIAAGLVWIGVIIILLYTALKTLFTSQDKSEQLFAILFIMIVVLFQLDAVQSYYSYMFLFATVSGLMYKEKKEINIPSFLPMLVSVFLVVCVILISISNSYFNKGEYKKALMFYPLRKDAYEPLIREQQENGNYKNVLKLLGYYGMLYAKNNDSNQFIFSINNSYAKKNNEN